MHPVLFEIPGVHLPVYSYGVMLGSSLILAWFLVMHLGTTKETLNRDTMANAFIITAISAIAGARLLYIATNPDEFTSFTSYVSLNTGGLVAYGGFLGGLVGAWIYLALKRTSILAWSDVVAPTLGTGLGLTRIGCYLFGCDFGARLGDGAPGWLKRLGTFPRWENGEGLPAFSYHVQTADLPVTASASYPVHPTQIYESLAGFALFGAAMLVWRYRKFRGQVILVIAMLYGSWRFFIEYVRDDPERGFYFGFSTSQLISLAIVPVCALLYYMLWRASRQAAPEPAVPTAPAPIEPRKSRPKKKRR